MEKVGWPRWRASEQAFSCTAINEAPLLVSAALAGGLSAAEARPLAPGEEAVLRAAPPLAEQNRTPAHLDALRAAGLTRHHRVSFCRTALGGHLELS